MWTIVELGELAWVALWDGEIVDHFDIYWSLDEAVEKLVRWYAGY